MVRHRHELHGAGAHPLKLVAGAAAGSALLLGALAAAYPEGAPPGHTGGFGEPTCQQCHADGPLNAPEGTLELEGVPREYAPERSYPLTIRLAHPELGRAGFQLSARFRKDAVGGSQAGELAGSGPRVDVIRGPGGKVHYAHQTREGSVVTGTETEWRVVWTAPARASASVAFHLAANAGNDDASEFGDFVYVLERTSAPDPEDAR